MSEQRKQHHVPQTYLKNFASGKKGDSLYTLSKQQRKVYPDRVPDAAAERHFYTLNNYEDKYFWDNLYTKNIEPEFGKTLQEIKKACDNVLVQSDTTVISEELKHDLVFHLIFQLLRGKQTRKYIKDLYEKTLPNAFARAEEHFKSINKEVLEKSFEKFRKDDEYFKELSMDSIFSEKVIFSFANILKNYIFVIYRNESEIPFITSDNPVMIVDSNTLNSRPFSNGLLVPSTVVLFPISSKLLLCAYNPYRFSPNGLDCKLKIMHGKDCENLVSVHNKLQISQNFNWAYSYSEETLNALKKLI